MLTKGHIKNSPFDDFKVIEEEYLERTTLTIEEVRKLSNTIPKKGNTQIRQAFLFSCFTGLRYSDIRKLRFLVIPASCAQNFRYKFVGDASGKSQNTLLLISCLVIS